MAITPTLRFADLPAALELYTGTLGFDVARGTVEEGNIAIERGDNRLMLEAGERVLRRDVQRRDRLAARERGRRARSTSRRRT